METANVCLGINGQHMHLRGCDGTYGSVCRKKRQEQTLNHNSHRVFDEHNVYLGMMWERVFYPKHESSSRVHKHYNDSDEALQRIINRLDNPTRAGRPRTEHKVPEHIQHKHNDLMELCDSIAITAGYYVMPMDTKGFPDRQYWKDGKPVAFVEFKVKGDTVKKLQAQRILELRQFLAEPIAVIKDSVDDFKMLLGIV